MSEWHSWGADALHCELCREDSYPRVHLLLNVYGSFTLWRPCTSCRHLHEAMSVPRQMVIDVAERLGGWTPAEGAYSLLEARRQHTALLVEHQRQRAMTANYGRGGGDRGA